MKKIIFVLIGILMITLFGCAENSYKTISATDAFEMMENEGVMVVDVREYEEYLSGHIEGAALLPLGDIETKAESVLPNKNDKIIVYCRSGVRSKKAAEKLIKQGYKKVYDMGGIIEWKNSGFSLITT